MALKFKLLDALPAQCDPHTQYYVKTGNNVVTYITDTNGVPFIQSKGNIDDSLEPLMFAGVD